MIKPYVKLSLCTAALLLFSSFACAAPLDDYYLQQFGETPHLQLQKAILSVSVDTQEHAHCGMPLKHGLRRDWNLLEQTTQKVLAKQLAAPTLSGTEQTVISSGGHFKVHYTTVAPDAPEVTGMTPAAWAQQVADTFESVHSAYISSSYNYRPAPLPKNNTGTYDIYLKELSGQRLYGYAEQPNQTADPNSPIDPNYVVGSPFPNSFSSYIVLDNDFTETGVYGSVYTPLENLQITAAHEYHHAVQFGYNYYFETWYAEATATWLEDELFDNVNQLYTYLPKYLSKTNNSIDMPIDGSSEYGRWIFDRYLAERHGRDMIRASWETLGSVPRPADGSDIPMLPVLDNLLSSSYGTSLSADFFGFATRIYKKNAWTDHQYDIGRIHSYTPAATYSVYPANSSVTNTVSLPHYSFAYYKFNPTAGVTSLTISISKSTGIQTALFKNGTDITADAGSSSGAVSYTASGLGTSDEVVLLIANTTTIDNHTAYFSTDGSLVAVTEPKVVTSTSGGSSNAPCFIATAAYGSYLHPQVQLLRNFRDEYLLTTAPGRAFVAFYYRTSPPLADFIARHPFWRSVTRLFLAPLVAAIAHPLIVAASLLLFIVTILASRLRRIKAANPGTRPDVIRITSSRL